MAECHSPPAHMALGYPYFSEIRGTDGHPKTIKNGVFTERYGGCEKFGKHTVLSHPL